MDDSLEAIYPKENTVDHLATLALEKFRSQDLLTRMDPKEGEVTSAYDPIDAANEVILSAMREYGMSADEFAIFITRQSGYNPRDLACLKDFTVESYETFQKLFMHIAEDVICGRMNEREPNLNNLWEVKEYAAMAYNRSRKSE